MQKNYYEMSQSATAQIEIDYLRGEVAKLKDNIRDIAKARLLLRKSGYFVEHLWSTDDVKQNYQCSEEQAQRVLEMALRNEATMQQIWFAIDDACETLEIRKITDSVY